MADAPPRDAPCPGAPPGAVPVGSDPIWTMLAMLAAPRATMGDVMHLRGRSRQQIHLDRQRLLELGFATHIPGMVGTYRIALTEVPVRMYAAPDRKP